MCFRFCGLVLELFGIYRNVVFFGFLGCFLFYKEVIVRKKGGKGVEICLI